ncbi:DUF4871 domain-containing protein [Bacillus sp. DX1.1]|uniref:DUF4871 domain-containing protein n=1 Tax=unclassified Bacillus (in: firmicutes) TaxID=185979 RepID=UPI00257099F7|nr:MULTISPECIES: DUF4871 domain-containing protein [unclassified Bacillus (in: firmicutes)]MDM5153374.1 DUF4871 domain-containing protein [Bacillus sp. DX1.1]WJE82331.1 DUF4871 domain-containing protein [Bacillus sp. DX3.1]
MKKIGIILLFSCLIAGCTTLQQETKSPVKETIETVKPQNNAPTFFHLSVLKDVNWQESPSFVEGKVAIADGTWIANEPNKQMWFFLDPMMPSGKLSVIALKQGSTAPTPVIFQNETSERTWTAPTMIDSTTKEIPILMSLPSPGLWLLNVYIGEKFYEQIVINVEKGDNL